ACYFCAALCDWNPPIGNGLATKHPQSRYRLFRKRLDGADRCLDIADSSLGQRTVLGSHDSARNPDADSRSFAGVGPPAGSIFVGPATRMGAATCDLE